MVRSERVKEISRLQKMIRKDAIIKIKGRLSVHGFLQNKHNVDIIMEGFYKDVLNMTASNALFDKILMENVHLLHKKKARGARKPKEEYKNEKAKITVVEGDDGMDEIVIKEHVPKKNVVRKLRGEEARLNALKVAKRHEKMSASKANSKVIEQLLGMNKRY